MPDLLCLGKGLTGRLPADGGDDHERGSYSAFLGARSRRPNASSRPHVRRQPARRAAALASLDVFDEEQTLAKLPAKIARLGEHLCRLAEHPHVATTRQRGLIGALELTPDKSTRPPLPRSSNAEDGESAAKRWRMACGCGRSATCCTSCRRWRSPWTSSMWSWTR